MADDQGSDADRDDEVLDELRKLREDLEDESELVSTPPREAFDLWIQQLDDNRESTLETYRYRINPFLEFLDRQEIDDLNEVTTRDVKEFEAERRAGPRGKQTLNNQLGTFKQFLAFCEELDAVTEDLVEVVNVPELSKEDRVNTEKLISERAGPILEDLDRYRYASLEHVLMLLLWRTTMRIGAIHSLDLEDVFFDEEDLDRLRAELLEEAGLEPAVVEKILDEAELPFIRPQHRPETDTPLKNGYAGERVVNIKRWVEDVIRDYIQVNRPDVVDDHGRRPLLASRKGGGRYSKSGMRNTTYILTQPCEFGGPCPHDRDPETCEAREHGHGSKCPSSRSPHKVRTGSITWHRDRGWPVEELADKANTSEELIRGVYDQPEQLIRGAVRRDYLDKLDEK